MNWKGRFKETTSAIHFSSHPITVLLQTIKVFHFFKLQRDWFLYLGRNIGEEA